MAPGKKKTEAIQQQDILQAVVVVDSFDGRFQPITDDIPLCLFPIANQPLLAYTLEFLALSGVQHIYVYCNNCSGLVKEYLGKSKWNSNTSQCQVTPVVSSDFYSLGSVLRDIDQKALFETDFILVAGNVVSNMSLSKALAEHRERRDKDKNKPLMTMLLKTCPPTHTTRSADDDFLVALNATTNQVLYYQGLSSNTKNIHIPTKSLLHCARFDLRYDLADTSVSICSPQVPQLFTDNFDYLTEEDFIRGILLNEEFLGNQIHAHVLRSRFASRVSTFHMYDTVNRAVISRWVYPHVPDNDTQSFVMPVSNKNRERDSEKEPCPYRHLRHNVYLGQIKSIGQDSRIEDNSVIGHDTAIGSGCLITNSVIGCNCTIGDNAVIRDSYVWDGVIVKVGCKITKSILCNEVVVHENCELSPGCILTNKVEVGPNITLNNDTVIHMEKDEIFMEEALEKKRNMIELGSKCRGMLWSEKMEDGSDDEMDKLVGGIWGMSVSERDRTLSESEESEMSGESSDDESEEHKSEDEDNSLKVFYREVKDSLQRGVEENISCSNLILEVNSSKYAYNVTVLDAMQCVTRAALEIASVEGTTPYFMNFKKILNHLSPVFLNYNKSSRAQLDCLNEIERYCLLNKPASDCLMKILMFLYEKEVLLEQTILHWHDNPEEDEPPPTNGDMTPEKLRKSVTKFIEWLQEAEEESSEEEES